MKYGTKISIPGQKGGDARCAGYFLTRPTVRVADHVFCPEHDAKLLISSFVLWQLICKGSHIYDFPFL